MHDNANHQLSNSSADPLDVLTYDSSRLYTIGKPFESCFVTRFHTSVGGDLRTTGIALVRLDTRANSLSELNLNRYSRAAQGGPADAAARGKILLIGNNFATVFQANKGRAIAQVICGQATLAVAAVLGEESMLFTLYGPYGRDIVVQQFRSGSHVEQIWKFDDFDIVETTWRGCQVALCTGANNYAIIVAPLPDGITPEQARRELVGDSLGAKLAVIEPSPDGVPMVTNYNASGLHGAIAASAALTLGVLRERSSTFATVLASGRVRHPTRAGFATISLPKVLAGPGSSFTAVMPAAHVMLTPFNGD